MWEEMKIEALGLKSLMRLVRPISHVGDTGFLEGVNNIPFSLFIPNSNTRFAGSKGRRD